MQGNYTGPDTSGKRAYEFVAAGWQTTRWLHTATVGTRQTNGMGCNSPGHLCRVAHSKTAKYGALSVSHIFVPVAVETAGTWGKSDIELVQEIGKRITTATEDTRETMFLIQRLSIALQKGNAIAFQSTYTLCSIKNVAVNLMSIPLSNLNRFSKFFHC